MLRFDHMTVLAPSLEEGTEYLGALLEIELINGSIHRDMGTHNRRVRLGETCYLEVIAVDPNAPLPSIPRWFGLDRTDAVRADWSDGLRLKGWVARTKGIDLVLKSHARHLGEKKWLENDFYFAVPPGGGLPMEGALPSVIDMGDQPATATGLEDQGVRLKEFVLEHPSPAQIKALYEELGIVDGPNVSEGKRPRFYAFLETSGGEKLLQ